MTIEVFADATSVWAAEAKAREALLFWEKSFRVRDRRLGKHEGGWQVIDAECEEVAVCDSQEKAEALVFVLNKFYALEPDDAASQQGSEKP